MGFPKGNRPKEKAGTAVSTGNAEGRNFSRGNWSSTL
jgi:hypothetical protein